MIDSEHMKLTVISNGHGEDLIACTLIDAFKKAQPSLEITGIPLVGNGHAYKEKKIKTLLKNPTFPSGGFIRSLADLLQDLKAGLLTHLFYQRKTVKSHIKNSDIVLAIGDIFCLIMSRSEKEKTIFFPTAKSDTFMKHSILEKGIIKTTSKLCFPRDIQTTYTLKKTIPHTYFFGNPMMDNLVTSEKIEDIDEKKPLIGILPGSRHEAYANLKHICKVAQAINNADYQYVVAYSPALSKEKLQVIVQNTPIKLTSKFKSLINQADVIIGLAGTANEQAMALSKPVIAFPGFGPQSTLNRFREQKKLMNDALTLCTSQDPDDIANTIINTLKQPQNDTKAPQNASHKIASFILSAMIR